tara:strand:- start:367 stop:636 length:270 start_codon:yes stop_codon:yes gene_type:complete
MDENKRSLLIHYLTEFILGSIGVGIFVILLYMNQFNFSLNIISLWVFIYNGVLFAYWIWKSDAKIWEKSIAGIYLLIIEIIIASSLSTF